MGSLIVDLSNVNTVTAGAFPLMRAAGVTAAWFKVSEGHTFTDQVFRTYEQRAEQAGLRVGGYHYCHPEANTPLDEARHFLSLYRGHDDRRALKVVLDMEEPKAAHLGRRLIDWAREWNRLVHHELGHWPLFYSNPDYINRMMGMTSGDRTIGGGLWLAAYGRDDGREHPFVVPAPWRGAVAHQFTSAGHMPGVVGNDGRPGSVDLSVAPRLLPLLAHGARGWL